jgi:hypothetical protein
MPIDFPASPSVGQQYTYAGVTYTYTAQGRWSAGVAGLTAIIPAGSLMMFQSTAAPSGWTKQTTHNDKALRIVNGATGSSGSIPFSTLFARTAIDGATMSISTMPSHVHSSQTYLSSSPGPFSESAGGDVGERGTTESAGGSQPHVHGLDLRVQYVDAIMASKN